MALLFKNITHFYNVQLPMGNDVIGLGTEEYTYTVYRI